MAKQQQPDDDGYESLDELRAHLQADGVENIEAVVQDVVAVLTSMPDFAPGPINDEYCWMHTPGGWTCVVCREAQ